MPKKKQIQIETIEYIQRTINELLESELPQGAKRKLCITMEKLLKDLKQKDDDYQYLYWSKYGKLDWEAEKEQMFEQMIQTIHEKTGIDIKPHVIQKNFLTPNDWEKDYHVYKGAVFNLAHGFDQMLHKRPQNNFKDIKNLYLVGGGTHPGSGLPTIYQSAIITANYLKKV